MPFAPVYPPRPSIRHGARRSTALALALVFAFAALGLVSLVLLVTGELHASVGGASDDRRVAPRRARASSVRTRSHTHLDRYADLTHLVLVAGHAVYMGHDFSPDAASRNSAWLLESYQRVPGQAETFIEHIRAGVEATAADDTAMLMFSGGETRIDAGPRSEATSYWSVADAAGWYGSRDSVRWRAVTEEGARDSYENVLFALCRFYELAGHYPERFTVVGYDFKRTRFEEVHRAAVRFPTERFHYLGFAAAPAARENAERAEERTLEAWRADHYGCGGELGGKVCSRSPGVPEARGNAC